LTLSSGPSAPERGQPRQRTLYIMFAAQFLSMIGFAFVLPFLPFYIRELGVADERPVPIWAGVMTAASGLVIAFSSPLWGWPDGIRYKKMLSI
jgi:DHA1 family multidrug resistance protein-like MFS transporter